MVWSTSATPVVLMRERAVKGVQNPSAEPVYSDVEQIERFNASIARLPLLDRELLMRSRLKGETLSAIAADTNIRGYAGMLVMA